MDLHFLLGDEAESLLTHTCTAFPKDLLTLPGPGLPRRRGRRLGPLAVGAAEPRHALRPRAARGARATCRSCPVDQGIEHSAAASFAKNPEYFDPARLCDLALAADCSAIADHAREPRVPSRVATCTGSRSS